MMIPIMTTPASKNGPSDNDADKESDNFPDSTVNETVGETRGKQEGLVPYVVSDSDEVATQETAPKPGLQPPLGTFNVVLQVSQH